jgi:hypothetical protein
MGMNSPVALISSEAHRDLGTRSEVSSGGGLSAHFISISRGLEEMINLTKALQLWVRLDSCPWTSRQSSWYFKLN